jgi:site-specific DNA-methyltransferase (adenine-specific)
MNLLISSWYLNVWDKLCDGKWNEIGVLQQNWYVNDGEETLSIHKMSAKVLNLTNNNWWDYFWVNKNWQLISINSLRYKYIEENK